MTTVGRVCWSLSLVAGALVAGCAVGPAYHVPAAPVPKATAYREGWKVASPSDHLLRGKWWQLFREPELNALEERVNLDNQTIKQSFETYMAARAQIREAQAGYFPTVTTSPSVTTSRSSGSTGFGTLNPTAGQGATTPAIGQGGATFGGGGQRFTSYVVPGEISWAPDLFGRVRNTVRQNQYAAQVSAADLESQRLLEQATLAQTYFQIRGQDALQDLLGSTVKSDQEILDATRALYTTGIGTDVAVVQAEQTLQTARVQATNAGILRAQYEHAIATLLGAPATDFTLAKRAWLGTPPSIPRGAPSQLLERRPDIAAAERQMAAANALVGVGYAAYFPTLTLTASGGFASSALSTLFSWPSRVWSLAASLSETLFDGGLRGATIDQYVASYNANVAGYRQTVLTAFQQVEDFLAEARILSLEVEQQTRMVALAQKAFDLEKVRYESGIDPYLTLMTQQTILLSAQQTLVSLEVQQMTSAVQLVEALGGGWDRSELPTPSAVSRHAPRS
jgi:NodT family efflux transporter outer membrane factor (OMF) lipoprotein